jgi:NAD dependent epimerase/dehydratase family enzyme
MGTGTQFFPWIHIDDVCRMVLFSIENNEVKGVVNGVAPEVIHMHFLSHSKYVKLYYVSDNFSLLLC